MTGGGGYSRCLSTASAPSGVYNLGYGKHYRGASSCGRLPPRQGTNFNPRQADFLVLEPGDLANVLELADFREIYRSERSGVDLVCRRVNEGRDRPRITLGPTECALFVRQSHGILASPLSWFCHLIAYAETSTKQLRTDLLEGPFVPHSSHKSQRSQQLHQP